MPQKYNKYRSGATVRYCCSGSNKRFRENNVIIVHRNCECHITKSRICYGSQCSRPKCSICRGLPVNKSVKKLHGNSKMYSFENEIKDEIDYFYSEDYLR